MINGIYDLLGLVTPVTRLKVAFRNLFRYDPALDGWVYGVVVSMFDFHCSDRGSNPGRGSKIS